MKYGADPSSSARTPPSEPIWWVATTKHGRQCFVCKTMWYEAREAAALLLDVWPEDVTLVEWHGAVPSQ